MRINGEYFSAEDIILGVAGMMVVGFFFLLLLWGGVEAVQSYRAEPAQIACHQRGLDDMRRSFHSAVTCVPRSGHGVDSLVVKGVN